MAHLGRVGLLGEVTSEIAHEVSQPLQAISNLVSTVIAVARKPNSQTPELINRLASRIDDALGLAQSILNRTRSFVANQDAQRSIIDLGTLIGETIEFVNFERKSLGIQLDQEVSDAPLSVKVDKVQIQQVLVNLIRNAFDAVKQNPGFPGEREVLS